MFVQVIKGKVRDKAEVRAQLDRWVRDLAPRSVGWLGTTAGVADDGTFVALARFESEAAADKNSSLPEQGEWWEAMAATLEGDPVFHDSTTCETDLAGDPGQAAFVQVMQGTTEDPERLFSLLTGDSEGLAAHRPDILGRLVCLHAGGDWTMAIWFTSEAAAREGEQKDLPPEVSERMAELRALSGEPSYVDLTDPWMDGPA
ncbi:hypothetical protein [Nocardioides marmoribigeumensis]|uniref:Antibiotic biosynthesis monooxygenase n=1 Tax=Nocardioides marmoribigeumensis TaxID=433649 RepID=A0ABU2BTE1_9ACTN|nr:hypothetical protein [Nocardioides marmoribigeumensis]MDR7361541.1 hypothetical protein [Nocardioides marmoribigeumensis]